jgi:DNA (cytosine-5)-methyltransferase 1
MADADQLVASQEREQRGGQQRGSGGDQGAGDDSHMADAVRSAGQQNAGSAFGNEASDGREGWDTQQPDGHNRLASHGKSYWSNAIWLTGADGKARRAQPGIPLLAHGIPNRVGKLRAYGNAIVPPLAAQVIKAYLDAEEHATKLT